MKLNQHLHLTYCSNIHPGETWSQVQKNLQTYLPALKNRLSPKDAFGIGLRLSDLASRELLNPEALNNFKHWLAKEDLYVFTMNGFPYGGFHNQVVKDQVYAPDWSKPERLDYTLRLTNILSALLPPEIEGGISTVPLSYKPWWTANQAACDDVFLRASQQLAELTAHLIELNTNKGQLIHIDLEPEPDGLLENATEVITYFKDWLLPVGGAWLVNKLNISSAQAEQHLLDHIQVCYDTCHFAVEYEQPQTVIEQFQAAGIKIGKGQLSSALKIEPPEDLENRKWMAAQLEPFAESTYLHQVIEQSADSQLTRHRDLRQALPHFLESTAKEWRTHFHVPIFIDRYQAFQSTQTDITDFLNALDGYAECRHLEIETYTWDVLPPDMKLDMLTSIEREYTWVLETLAAAPQS